MPISKRTTPSYLIDDIHPSGEEQKGLLKYAGKEKPFHLGQEWEDEKAKQVACSKCGGDQFHVGQGNFYTAIRCVTCKWEMGIHSG